MNHFIVVFVLILWENLEYGKSCGGFVFYGDLGRVQQEYQGTQNLTKDTMIKICNVGLGNEGRQ